jgi:hypothetical protein
MSDEANKDFFERDDAENRARALVDGAEAGACLP